MMEMEINNMDVIPEPFRSRMITYRDTLEICKQVPESNTYTYEYTPAWSPARRFENTRVTVEAIDTFVAARDLVRRGRVACMSCADDCHPTGCASTGSGCQEASLCYRSTLSNHLHARHYPIADNALLCSPGVQVFKAPEEEGFRALSAPFSVVVITCSGILNPRLYSSGTDPRDTMTPDDMLILRTKIETILQAAYLEGVTDLVLGALGCGARNNPPEDVAEAFRIVIARFPGLFSSIVFAIKPSSRRTRCCFSRILDT